MTLSVRTRFEVFKRDRFTCSYCGRHAPDVLLECDHIIPRAAGGSDDITNLTTSCAECNSGKSDRLLEEGTSPTIRRATVDDLRERLEQAAAYTELVGQQAALIEKQVGLINQMWATVFKAQTIERADGTFWQFEDHGEFPNQRSIRLFLRRLPMHEIVAAIDVTASRFEVPTSSVCRFFYKVCWRRIKGESGPIDGPGPVQELEPWERVEFWRDEYAKAAGALGDASTELESAQSRIDDLEDEVRDLRKIIETYQEARSGGLTRLGDP